MFKVSPFVDHLLATLKDVHSPGKELTIDEQICPFRCRINFRVYVKGKPHKYGIKLWMLCDAVTGLPVNFEIYTGKSNDDLSVNKVDNLVQRLVKDVEEKKKKRKKEVVYMDRYFMAPGIANKLFEKGIYSVGTVKSNRKELPDLLKGKKLKKGEHVAFRSGPVLAVKWKDTRYVICVQLSIKMI